MSFGVAWGLDEPGPVPPPNAPDVEVVALQPYPDSRLGVLPDHEPQARYDRMQWPGLRCHRPVACGVVEIGHRPVEREVIRKRDPLKSPFWFAHA